MSGGSGQIDAHAPSHGLTAPAESLVLLHPSDNVLVAVTEDAAVRGHKFGREPIAAGQPIVKLGQRIGVAREPIAAGAHLHSHNVDPARAEITADAAGSEVQWPDPVAAQGFEGFCRPDGRVGTRNHLLVLTSVNCSSSVARVVAHQARTRGLAEGLDGIEALTHQGGCAIGTDSRGLANLRRTLAGYATHPNVGGALIIGLGCEVNQIDGVLSEFGLAAGERLRTLVIQDEGGSSATIEAGVCRLAELAEMARADSRSAASAADLVLALQCGGSDGYSALTANPVLGRVSDHLIAQGGTTILGETPEMHGAEELLIRRAASRAVAQQLLDRLEWWRNHSEPEDNPSPGNKMGGLTTIAEKSLGAVAKGGTSPLVDVLDYAEPVRRRGFMVMDSPGYDPCSVTGQIASGSNLVCFTTGRGSVSGFAPVPTIKIATNSGLARSMAGDIDFDSGGLVTGDASLDGLAEGLFDLLIAVASGRQTSSEALGFGEEEFVPWQMGVVT